MARLKKVLDWFVTIEHDDEDAAAEEEEYDDEEYEDEEYEDEEHIEDAAPAARTAGGGKRVRVVDMGLDPYAGELDEAGLGRAESGMHSFGEIYAAAGLAAEEDGGFNIFKVEQMLQSTHIAELSSRAKAASVRVALEATGASLQNVIQDAVSRDKALDHYESMQRKDLKNLEDEVEYDNALIQAEIEAYLEEKQAQIRANREKLETARVTFENWLVHKGQEEQRLFDAVSLFVEENPITRE